MASISKRKYWADPVTGKEVKAGTPGAVQKESRFYRIRYTDAAGNRPSVKGYTDLRATVQLAGRLEAAAARGEEGLVNRYAAHDKRPLWDTAENPGHIDDYLADLAALDRDDRYRYLMGKRLRRLCDECGWQRLRDITPESFKEWRRKQAAAGGIGGKTLNQWYDSASGFLNWCAAKEQRRVAVNPLAGMQKLPESPTFQRRALQVEEIEGLYAGGARDGAKRWQVYAFLVTTGLRRQETEDLLWEDAIIDAPTPFLKLREEATKARRADVFALKPEIAQMLRQFRPANWRGDQPVFADGVPSVEVFLDDLRAGGVAVPAADSIDRLDIHALRTTLGSFLGRSGVAERTAMELLRVTDPKLLRKTYCDPRILQTALAVEKLAIPTPSQIAGAAAPGQNRTAPMVKASHSAETVEPIHFTVLADKELPLRDLGLGVSRLVTATEGGTKTPRVGIEPTKNPLNFSQNLQASQAAGPFSDRPLQLKPPDVLLASLADLWPHLSVTARTSIVALAKAAANPGGEAVGSAG